MCAPRFPGGGARRDPWVQSTQNPTILPLARGPGEAPIVFSPFFHRQEVARWLPVSIPWYTLHKSLGLSRRTFLMFFSRSACDFHHSTTLLAGPPSLCQHIAITVHTQPPSNHASQHLPSPTLCAHDTSPRHRSPLSTYFGSNVAPCTSHNTHRDQQLLHQKLQ